MDMKNKIRDGSAVRLLGTMGMGTRAARKPERTMRSGRYGNAADPRFSPGRLL